MIYYEHHLGDCLRDTAHLSMVEDGAYRRLLDQYYIKEQPLPGDFDQCCRIARANSPAERKAVATVLKEFFDMREDGYHQARADEEIERYRQKKQRAKNSANARWSHSERNANALPTQCEGNALQSPITNPQAPDTQVPPSARDSEPVDTRARDPGGDAGQVPISAAGQACMAMREAGLLQTNPSHPHLLAAIAEGVTAQELADLVREHPGKSMTYVVAAARGRRSEPIAVVATLGAKPVRRLNLITAEEAEERERLAGVSHAAH